MLNLNPWCTVTAGVDDFKDPWSYNQRCLYACRHIARSLNTESDRQAECGAYATGYANQSQSSDDYDSSVVEDRR